MIERLGFGGRLAVFTAVGAGMVLGAMVLSSYLYTRAALEEELEGRAHQIALAAARKIDLAPTSVSAALDGLRVALETYPTDAAQAKLLLRNTLRMHHEVFAVCMAYAPGHGARTPYAYRRGPTVVVRDLPGVHRQSWYSSALRRGRNIWSDPYFDMGGSDTYVVTCATPVYRQGKLLGVAACDVSLDWLSDFLAALPVGTRGYAFLLDRQGVPISSPISHRPGGNSPPPPGALPGQPSPLPMPFRKTPRIVPRILDVFGRRLTSQARGYFLFQDSTSGNTGWVVHERVPSTGWTVAAFLSREETRGRIVHLRTVEVSIGLAGLAMLMLVSYLLSRSMVRPIERLEHATATLAAGDLDAPLPEPQGRDELARLTGSFAAMRQALKERMADLEVVTADRERIAGEMRIAGSIQQSLLPDPLPAGPGPDVDARISPAREVGGDLYDHQLLPNDSLALAVGDVSGKGLPAALLMAVTRTHLRGLWPRVDSPSDLMRQLNRLLEADCKSSMFVTLTCLLIDTGTGQCRYARGGHAAPVVVRADGSVEPLPEVRGALLGVETELTYDEGSLELAPGDRILLYTDGVTEARNAGRDLFGAGRLVAALGTAPGGSAGDLAARLLAVVGDFVGGEEQSDDMAIVVYRQA